MDLFIFYVPEWVMVFVNLLILTFILKKVLWNRVGKVLDERQALVDKAIEDAKTVEIGMLEMEERRAAFEDEFASLTATQMQEARRRAGTEYDRIVVEAENKAKLIVSTAQTQAEKIKDAKLNEAKNEIISSVLEMTGMLMESNMDSEQNEQLVSSFLERKGVAR